MLKILGLFRLVTSQALVAIKGYWAVIDLQSEKSQSRTAAIRRPARRGVRFQRQMIYDNPTRDFMVSACAHRPGRAVGISGLRALCSPSGAIPGSWGLEPRAPPPRDRPPSAASNCIKLMLTDNTALSVLRRTAVYSQLWRKQVYISTDRRFGWRRCLILLQGDNKGSWELR